MTQLSFLSVFTWITSHSYPFVFLAMCVEGLIVTIAASLAAGLGYFSLTLIFLLSIFGDLLPDVAYYYIGVGGWQAAMRWATTLKPGTSEHIQRIERLMHKHSIKAVAVIKFIPFLPLPMFVVLGARRFPFSKFMAACLLVTIPRNILFIGLGYYLGRILLENQGIFDHIELISVAVAVFIIAVSIAYSRFSRYLAQQIEDDI